MSKTLSLDSKQKTNQKNLEPKALVSLKTKGMVCAMLGGVLMLAGCATKPVYQNSSPKVQVNARGVPNYYQVKSGDTVSQISQRYGLNYRQVGALNRLDSRYTIYAGQWLKLWEGGNVAAAPTYQTQPVRNQNPYAQQQTRPVTPTPQANTGAATVVKGYVYPTTNPVTKNFNASSGDMSMWFSGRAGDPIVASNAGQVLYSGNGLPEYGNLIMIRHDDRYITVYAHNTALLVKEGDRVQAGQQIATMGSSGQTSQVGLQFQVRENGTPIDPRSVLGL